MIRVSREIIEFDPIEFIENKRHGIGLKPDKNGCCASISVHNNKKEHLRISAAGFDDLINIEPRETSEEITEVIIEVNQDKLERKNKNYETSLIISSTAGETKKIPLKFSSVRKYYIPSRAKGLYALLLFLFLSLGGVYFYLNSLGIVGEPKIDKLMKNSACVNGRIVTISGYVQSTDTSHYPPDLFFTLRDDTGKITIFSNRAPPQPGQLLKVTGKVEVNSEVYKKRYDMLLFEAVRVR